MTEPTLRLLDTDATDIRFQDALSDLFSGDGTIYIISGYFTYHGYRSIRDDIIAFLERSRENKLITVVGPASDQFSARIAYDLWKLDDHNQIKIYKQPRGLHAKLYLRDGPNPTCLIGSANITQVAFRYNIELNIEITRESTDDADFKPLLEWAEELVAASAPLRRRDILAPMQFGGSIRNWSNKAKLLPKRDVVIRVIPFVMVVLLLSMLFRFV